MYLVRKTYIVLGFRLLVLPENGHQYEHTNDASNTDNEKDIRCNEFCRVHKILEAISDLKFNIISSITDNFVGS